jgi:diamine N-acetyltransferase
MFRIDGNKIYLRLPEEGDAAHILSWENGDAGLLYNRNGGGATGAAVQSWIANRHHDLIIEKELRMMICTKENSLAGSIDLFEYDEENRRAGLGIIVEEHFRRKGLASESIFLVKRHCFQKLGIQSLWCNISASNTASIALFEKCGFGLSGTKRKWRLSSGNDFEDELFFQCFA